MPALYPTDRSVCMNCNSPTNHHYQVSGGELQYSKECDTHFPYLYAMQAHTLIHSSKYIKKILVHIVDTSINAHVACFKFAKTLSVPLGPDALMETYGWLNLFSFYPYVMLPTDICLILQVFLNLNQEQSYSLGPFMKIAHIGRKMTLYRVGA